MDIVLMGALIATFVMVAGVLTVAHIHINQIDKERQA